MFEKETEIEQSLHYMTGLSTVNWIFIPEIRDAIDVSIKLLRIEFDKKHPEMKRHRTLEEPR